MAHPTEARSYLQRAVELSAYVVSMAPSLGHARRGRIEATFQLGRAQSFAYDYSEAEKSFQKTRELATRWLADEPRNSQASDMLASCSRKLADMRKFAKDFDGASKLYRDAIAIGERLMIDVPGNTEYQEHLATALQDLAGVLSKTGKPDEARPLLEHANAICTRLIAADPESVESQARLVTVMTDLGHLARDESKFAVAAEHYQRAVDLMLALLNRGNSRTGPVWTANLSCDCTRRSRNVATDRWRLARWPPSVRVRLARRSACSRHVSGYSRPGSIGRTCRVDSSTARPAAETGGRALRTSPLSLSVPQLSGSGQQLRTACQRLAETPAELRRWLPGYPEPRRSKWLPGSSANRVGRDFYPIRRHPGYLGLIARLKGEPPHRSGSGG